jgi:Spy/CpxP family protein refolding chaperone
MIKKATIFVMSALLLISFSSLLEAKAGAPGMLKHMKQGIRMAEKNLFPAQILLKLKEKVGLTKDQVRTIEKMRDAHQESTIRRTADIKILELKIGSYMEKEKINRGKLEKMLREVAAMKTDLTIANINYLLDLRDLLTPEQIKKIESIKSEMKQRRMERRLHRREAIKERLRKH